MTETGDILGRTLPALVLFVGAPLVIWWVRRSRGAVASAIRVVSRTALTRNSVIAVIETDERRFLIGATDHGIQLLSELEGQPTPITDNTLPAPAAPVGPWTSPLETLRAMTARRAPRQRPPRVHRS